MDLPIMDDLNLLKITKVKDWIIYFDYGDRHFFIKGFYDDYDCYQTIYEKTYSGTKYGITEIKSKPYVTEYVGIDYILDYNKHKTITYKHINKGHFLMKLCKNGLIKGFGEDKIRRSHEKIKLLKHQLELAKNDVNKIRELIRKEENADYYN